MVKITAIVGAATVLAPTVYAWGNLGHETIAYVAQDFVSSETATFVQKILGSTSSSYMASVATWADTYRYTSAGEWSEPLHFIDAKDKYVDNKSQGRRKAYQNSPPTACNVNFARDCATSKCVVGALTNFVCSGRSGALEYTLTVLRRRSLNQAAPATLTY